MTHRERREVHRGLHKKNISPKPLTGKTREAEFSEFLQPVGLKDWSSRGLQHGQCEALRSSQCSCGEGGQTTWEQTVQFEDTLGHTGRDPFPFL